MGLGRALFSDLAICLRLSRSAQTSTTSFWCGNKLLSEASDVTPERPIGDVYSIYSARLRQNKMKVRGLYHTRHNAELPSPGLGSRIC